MKWLPKALRRRRVREVVCASPAWPRKKPSLLKRIGRAFLALVLSLLLSTTVKVTFEVDLAPGGSHPAQA